MPTYVYECQSCSKVIEVEQRISDNPLENCGCDSGGQLKKIMQPTAVLFKGAGFHVNDYSGSPTSTPLRQAAKAEACDASGSCPACAND